jgi:putative transposase
MIRTHIFKCQLDRAQADALNAESGRIYRQTLVWHYRIYRRTGHWLSQGAAERLGDYLSGTFLHAHSRDAAQQAFYKACKTAKTNGAHYPHKRKRFRPTIWKNSGIQADDGVMRLALARGHESLLVRLPEHLSVLPQESFREARLVYDRAANRYEWHIVVEDGQELAPAPGERVAAVDLGEIHPASITDGEEAVVITNRALRANSQYTAKRLAEFQHKQAAKVKGSRAWWRLQQRKNRFLAKQRRRRRDMEHKASRAVVDWAVEREVGTLPIGDVQDVADGKRMHAKSQQKIGLWAHGRMRRYITYKAQAAGIEVPDLVDETYSSQTCPQCGRRHKPTGRVYRCPACGFVAHRDVVGSVNILSRYLHGDVGHIIPPSTVKYRQPFGRASEIETKWPFVLESEGKRSPSDTGQVAIAAGSRALV